jgi:hypothetical protein
LGIDTELGWLQSVPVQTKKAEEAATSPALMGRLVSMVALPYLQRASAGSIPVASTQNRTIESYQQ